MRMLDIPPGTFGRAYNNVANSALWFLLHQLFDTPNEPQFGAGFRRDWESYVAYNEMFADALAQEAGAPAAAGGARAAVAGDLRILVQDYHLCLVPRLLRERLGDAAREVGLGHFCHTPWAPPDYYRMLPADIGRALLDGILGADRAGFHARRWATAFMDCCAALLGAGVERAEVERPGPAGWVTYRGHVTEVAVHPLGVDATALRERARAGDVQAHAGILREAAGGRKLIVRVDRTELSKNIVRGLAAYRELLATRPQWRGRVVHLAFAYPSRSDLAEYRAYTERVRQLALEITGEFGTADWNPLILEVKDDYPRSLAACTLADVLLVNPIRDGMNLVAQEGPVLSERGCALVLSRRGRRRRDAGRRRPAGQPVRHHRDGRRPAPGAGHARRRAPAPQRRARRHRRRGPAGPLARRPAGLARPLTGAGSRDRRAPTSFGSIPDLAGQLREQGHHPGGSVHHQVGRVGDLRRLGTGAGHGAAGDAVGPQRAHRGEGRQVPEVIPAEQDRTGGPLAGQPGQRGTFVHAWRPQLDHQAAGLRGQAEPLGQLAERLRGAGPAPPPDRRCRGCARPPRAPCPRPRCRRARPPREHAGQRLAGGRHGGRGRPSASWPSCQRCQP